MNVLELKITSSDIHGVEEMVALLRECEGAALEELRERYARIGEILAANVARLGLDEDIFQLSAFARCFGCQVLIVSGTRSGDPDDCWRPALHRKHPPFVGKQDGQNMSWSEVRTPDGQQAVMIRTIACILGERASFAAGANSLLEFQESQRLWTEADTIDRD